MDEALALQIDNAFAKMAGLFAAKRGPGRMRQIVNTFWQLHGLWQQYRAAQLKS